MVKRIYIAGPITGVADYKERFAEAERFLREVWPGATIFNPAARLPAGMHNAWYMERCCAEVCRCDVVYCVPGIGEGRRVMEVDLARACDIPVVGLLDVALAGREHE